MLTRAIQDHQGGENWQLTGLHAQTSQDLHCGESCFFIAYLEQAWTGFTGPKLLLKCLFRSLTALEQVCTNFTGPQQSLKRLLSALFITKTGLHELHNTPTVVKTAFKIFHGTVVTTALSDVTHLNRSAQTSQGFHNDENCFLQLSQHLNRCERASQDVNDGENGFVGHLPHLNRSRKI